MVGQDKVATLDYSTYPHIFRSILPFLPRSDLAAVLRTSRSTGKDAGGLLYRTVHLDLGVQEKGPSRPSPLSQPNTSQKSVEDIIRPNVWVSARVDPEQRGPTQYAKSIPVRRSSARLSSFIAAQASNVPPQSILAFPGDILSHLRTARTFETGPHDDTACTAFAKFTSPLSGLELWRFRPSRDLHHFQSPRTTRHEGRISCGRGYVTTIKGCTNPIDCILAHEISPWHLVILPADDQVRRSDLFKLLALRALQDTAPTTQQLTVTLPAHQIGPVRSYIIQQQTSEVTVPFKPVHLTLLEIILWPDESGTYHFRSDNSEDLYHFGHSSADRVVSYLGRLRDIIVERLCDTRFHIRLIGSELIKRLWLDGVNIRLPEPNWSFEEELRRAIDASHVAEQSTDEAKIAVRQARQDRVSFTDIRDYASSVEATDSLGEEDAGALRRALDCKHDSGMACE